MNRRNFLQLTSASLVNLLVPGAHGAEGLVSNRKRAPEASASADNRPIIAMVLYPEFTALDLVGPYQFLSALTDYRVVLVAEKAGPVVTDTGMTIGAEMSFADCPKNVAVIFLPGGTSGTVAAMRDRSLTGFVADRAKTAKYITSVCTGSLILASIGLLQGRKATCHWLVRDKLNRFGARPIDKRVVVDGKVITGAGVSAGLDLGLALIDKLAGSEYAKHRQLWFEYDPEPMHDAGSPAKSRKQDVSMLRGMVGKFRNEIDKVPLPAKPKSSRP